MSTLWMRCRVAFVVQTYSNEAVGKKPTVKVPVVSLFFFLARVSN